MDRNDNEEFESGDIVSQIGGDGTKYLVWSNDSWSYGLKPIEYQVMGAIRIPKQLARGWLKLGTFDYDKQEIVELYNEE